MMDVSIIIVSWNTRAYLKQCLESVRVANSQCVQEVIVVDNASADGSPEMVEKEFPEVRLIRAGSNLGFARGNNLAMTYARGNMFALVNSDALVHVGCLDTLAAFLHANSEVGLVGPRVIGGDGRLQRTCRRLPGVWNTFCRTIALDRVLPNWPLFSGYELTDRDHEVRREVDVLSGCFCMARREAVDAIGGLDEQFFFYGEDIDWCKRFADAGWKVVFFPEANATHFGGGSTANAPLRYSIEILRATLKYWRKHYGVGGEIVSFSLMLAHHGIRLAGRALSQALGFGRSAYARYKVREDLACVRWLLTGKSVQQ